jgi:hypothetical protein
MSTTKTKVIFRIDSQEVIALFPQDAGTMNAYTCSCYVHNGQHSSADPDLVIRQSKPATPKEYRPLAKELRRIGYRLHIVKRQNRSADLMARRAQIIR